MEETASLEIRIIGQAGNKELKPVHYDIKELSALFKSVGSLLRPDTKNQETIISYLLQEGSVRNTFTTSKKHIEAIQKILLTLFAQKTIDFLLENEENEKIALAIESLQEEAYKKERTFELKTSLGIDKELVISPKTNYIRPESYWFDSEFYLYGELQNIGGKKKCNIHIGSDEYGDLIVQTDKTTIEHLKENLLYKTIGIRASGKENIKGEFKKNSLKLIEFLDYNPTYDQNYINQWIAKAGKHWKGVDPEKWLSELRGDYDDL